MSEEQDEAKETGRLEAFSDGVFAIAITLLVLSIQVPHNAPGEHKPLLSLLFAQWPAYLAYVISFMTILIMWVNHHTIFRLIQRTDQFFLVLNGVLLMTITFVNYPTAVLADSIQKADQGIAALFYNGFRPWDDQRTAALLYSGTFVLTAILYNLLWRYAAYNRQLIGKRASQVIVDTITRQYRFGPIFYLVAFLLGFVSVAASLAVNLLLAVYFAFAGRPKRPRTHA